MLEEDEEESLSDGPKVSLMEELKEVLLVLELMSNDLDEATMKVETKYSSLESLVEESPIAELDFTDPDVKQYQVVLFGMDLGCRDVKQILKEMQNDEASSKLKEDVENDLHVDFEARTDKEERVKLQALADYAVKFYEEKLVTLDERIPGVRAAVRGDKQNAAPGALAVSEEEKSELEKKQRKYVLDYKDQVAPPEVTSEIDSSDAANASSYNLNQKFGEFVKKYGESAGIDKEHASQGLLAGAIPDIPDCVKDDLKNKLHHYNHHHSRHKGVTGNHHENKKRFEVLHHGHHHGNSLRLRHQGSTVGTSEFTASAGMVLEIPIEKRDGEVHAAVDTDEVDLHLIQDVKELVGSLGGPAGAETKEMLKKEVAQRGKDLVSRAGNSNKAVSKSSTLGDSSRLSDDYRKGLKGQQPFTRTESMLLLKFINQCQYLN